jgi:hypothetical protein
MMSRWTKQGLEQGHVKGMRELLCALLEKKFGPLKPDVVNKLETLPPQRITEIALAYTDVASLKELGLTDK